MDENHYWRAVQERDGTQDGRFYYGVVTTGIYCRPSCASRLPLRRNVRFYTTPAQATSRRGTPLFNVYREGGVRKLREKVSGAILTPGT